MLTSIVIYCIGHGKCDQALFYKLGSLPTSPVLEISMIMKSAYPNSMTQSKRFTVLVALVVALGGFVWGFDATVISGAVPFIQKYFRLTGGRGDWLLGLAVSCLGG